MWFGNIFGGELDGVIQSFEDRSGYIQPFASLLGEAMNSGWYQSAHVSKHFGFYIGLPMTGAIVGNNDRVYTETYTDPSGAVPPQSFQTPTILGTGKAPTIYQYILGLNNQKIDSVAIPYSDGLLNLPVLPFASLQLGFSAYNTELKLRYFGLPGVKGANVSLPGIGIQHDLSWFLPTGPISLSVAGNITFITMGMKGNLFPASDSVTGSFNLSGTSSFAGVLAGYRWKAIEIFLDGGWEHTKITSSGNLTLLQLNQSVSPKFDLVGRNNFCLGLNLGFDLGWNPVFGASIGNVNSCSANILGYKYSRD